MTDRAVYEQAAADAGLVGAAAKGWADGLERGENEPASTWVWDREPIRAVSMGDPWIEQRWPQRKSARLIRLHGGRLDGCTVESWALGETLTVAGSFYSYQAHDEQTADYDAVDGDW